MKEELSVSQPSESSLATRPSEAALDFLEAQIPKLGVGATQAAFLQTLASGQSTLISDAGSLYEVFPDGSRRFIKILPPLVTVNSGAKISMG